WLANHPFQQQHGSGQRAFQRGDSGRSHQRNVHGQQQCRRRVDRGHYLCIVWWRDQGSLAHRDGCSSSTPHSLVAGAESHERYWRRAIFHGHGDAQLGSSSWWRANHTFQQQHGSGQGAYQRGGCLRSLERDIHGQHECRRRIDHGHHLCVLRCHYQVSLPHRGGCASSTPHPFVADAESHKRYWRLAIFHGHGNAKRASSRWRCDSHAFQQQRRGQGAIQCVHSGGSHQCEFHGEHIHSSLLDFRHDLGFPQRNDSDGNSFCALVEQLRLDTPRRAFFERVTACVGPLVVWNRGEFNCISVLETHRGTPKSPHCVAVLD